MTKPLDIATLELAWPSLPWREPVPVKWPDATLFACRVCVASFGLKRDSPHQWANESEAQQHVDEHTQ